jgi:hypothetical protein
VLGDRCSFVIRTRGKQFSDALGKLLDIPGVEYLT